MSEKTLRILLAESQPSEVVETVRALFAGQEGDLQLTVVSTIATLLSSLKVANPEIILLDLSLYISEPYDAVRVVRRAAPEVPLIVFADPADKQRAAQSLAEGAIDYLLKGFMDSRTVYRAQRSAMARNTMEGLAHLLRDPVTGLYTREGFLTLGVREQAEVRRRGGALVLLCARIDHFQMLRDRFGPGAAERALGEVAKILNGCCRRTDVVARVGEEQIRSAVGRCHCAQGSGAAAAGGTTFGDSQQSVFSVGADRTGVERGNVGRAGQPLVCRIPGCGRNRTAEKPHRYELVGVRNDAGDEA